MICKHCWANIPENQTKCPTCGTENTDETDYISATGAERVIPKGFSAKKNIIVIIIIAAALLIGGIVTAVTVSNSATGNISVSETLQLAERYLSEQNYEQAVIEFQKVLEIEPMNVEAYLGLADTYMALGETDKAIELLENGFNNTRSDKIKDKLNEIRESIEPVVTAVTITETVTTEVAETESATEEPLDVEYLNLYFKAKKGDVIKPNINTTENIKYLSLNPYVAQVDLDGTVIVLHKGEAHILVTSGDEIGLITINSMSDDVNSMVNHSIINGMLGAMDNIYYFPDYPEAPAGWGEYIERDDYDKLKSVESYIHSTSEDYLTDVFSYDYVYLENNNIMEENHIMVDGSTYNGLKFYDCETAFYREGFHENAIVRFSTIGEVTLNVELLYKEEADPYMIGDIFYLKILSLSDSVLPFVGPDGERWIELRMSDILKNKLKMYLNENDSLGICKITLKNYYTNWYPIWGGDCADLVEVEILGNTYTDNPDSVLIGENEYRTDILNLDLSDMGLYDDGSNIRFLKNLETLKLGENTFVLLHDLVNLENLKELYIGDNKFISEANIETLRKILPNCKIYY